MALKLSFGTSLTLTGIVAVPLLVAAFHIITKKVRRKEGGSPMNTHRLIDTAANLAGFISFLLGVSTTNFHLISVQTRVEFHFAPVPCWN